MTPPRPRRERAALARKNASIAARQADVQREKLAEFSAQVARGERQDDAKHVAELERHIQSATARLQPR